MKDKLIGRKEEGRALRLCSGQGTLEVLIAAAIVVTVIGAAIIVVFGGQTLSLDTRENERAVALARGYLEQGIVAARADFALVQSTSSAQNGFTKELFVTSVNANTKELLSRVSWQAKGARTLKVELMTRVTNWQSVLGGGPISGDWKNPQTLGSIDLGPGNAGTGIRVKNGIVYMTGIASDSKKPDIFLIDATNPSGPSLITSTSTGPGANTLALKFPYVFLANRDSNAEFQIVDVSVPSQPQLVRSFNIAGLSGNKFINRMVIRGNLLYAGTDNNPSGEEFFIIDISDPLNPNVVGSFEVGVAVNAVWIVGSTVYLGRAHDQELQAVDVSVPASPAPLGTLNVTGTVAYGKSTGGIVGSSVIYLGRLTGVDREFYAVDVSSPQQMEPLGSIDVTGDVNAILVQDYLAFVATNDPNNEFKIYNITDSTNITRWDNANYNFPQDASDVAYENNIVFVSVRSNDALRIITSGP